MSFKKVSPLAAMVAATFALSAVAYADTGKSPNGAPGPAGNPNQPASQPQANAPQGPAGNSAQGQSQSAPAKPASPGKSNASHGKSNASHGKSGESHGKSQAQHPSSTHGNSAEGHSNNFGHGKITICHATKSVKNPYVEITISVNGLHGHGPTDSDPVSRHHAGSWKDIIPAPTGGCPGTVEQSSTPQATTPQSTPQQTAAPEAAKAAPASAVLGAHASGHSKAKDSPQTAVLGANASGGDTPKSATAARRVSGSLPFTGTQLAFILIAAAVALLGGLALRRRLSSQS